MRNVLMLNASFEVLRTISVHRAIVLMVQNKVDVIETTGEVYRSPSTTIEVPSVVRLKEYRKVPYRARLPLNRRAVLSRDNHECQFTHCHRKGTTIDHVQPRSKGGRHEWTNVVAACSRCNAKKADKLMKEIGWELKRQPQAPDPNKFHITAHNVPSEWEPYLA